MKNSISLVNIILLLSSQIKPKLVVGIVVDQPFFDYIYRFWDKFMDLKD